ncbi:MAG: 23S rRNA (guanosine(2251)-2'-O)-methyltransferase RlmB [Myxococcales bacterium]|nr:23S rRNA (guanosine(2251)-2'-O)-methyltransferase RlmB [Myxococcales bacterium]
MKIRGKKPSPKVPRGGARDERGRGETVRDTCGRSESRPARDERGRGRGAARPARDERTREGRGESRSARDERGREGRGESRSARDERGREGRGATTRPARDERGREGRDQRGESRAPRDERASTDRRPARDDARTSEARGRRSELGDHHTARARAGGPERGPDEPRWVVGRRFVLEGLDSGTVTRVWIEAGLAAKLEDVVSAARDAGVVVREASRATLDERAAGARHQGVVGEAAPFGYVEVETLLAAPSPLLVALDEITDPHNFGAILRSAVAFGVDGVITPRHRAAGVTPVVVRASAGATEHARVALVTNLQRTLAELADRGLEIVGLEAEGTTTLDALGPAPGGRVVVIGSEGRGLRRLVRERCDVLARIPQVGPVSSLNASVAAGIALYEASKHRSPPGD